MARKCKGKIMQVTIDAEDIMPQVILESIESTSCAIERLNGKDQLYPYEVADLVEDYKLIRHLIAVYKYYAAPSEWDMVKDYEQF